MNKAEVLYRTFPRRASCEISFYGTGTAKQTFNYFCVLAPNVLSQYVFLVLWFWYVILIIINFINLCLVGLMLLRVSAIRNMYLMRVIGSRELVKKLNKEEGTLAKEIKRLHFGQFLFLYLVAKNTPFTFVQELLKRLTRKLAPNSQDKIAPISATHKQQQIRQ